MAQELFGAAAPQVAALFVVTLLLLAAVVAPSPFKLTKDWSANAGLAAFVVVAVGIAFLVAVGASQSQIVWVVLGYVGVGAIVALILLHCVIQQHHNTIKGQWHVLMNQRWSGDTRYRTALAGIDSVKASQILEWWIRDIRTNPHVQNPVLFNVDVVYGDRCIAYSVNTYVAGVLFGYLMAAWPCYLVRILVLDPVVSTMKVVASRIVDIYSKRILGTTLCAGVDTET